MSSPTNHPDTVTDETSRMSCFDLYEDLLVKENQERDRLLTLEEVVSEKQSLAEQNKLLMQQLVETAQQAKKFEEEKLTLERNFQSLLATAKVEIERKNRLLSYYTGSPKPSRFTAPSNQSQNNTKTTQKLKKQSFSLKGRRIADHELRNPGQLQKGALEEGSAARDNYSCARNTSDKRSQKPCGRDKERDGGIVTSSHKQNTQSLRQMRQKPVKENSDINTVASSRTMIISGLNLNGTNPNKNKLSNVVITSEKCHSLMNEKSTSIISESRLQAKSSATSESNNVKEKKSECKRFDLRSRLSTKRESCVVSDSKTDSKSDTRRNENIKSKTAVSDKDDSVLPKTAAVKQSVSTTKKSGQKSKLDQLKGTKGDIDPQETSPTQVDDNQTSNLSLYGTIPRLGETRPSIPRTEESPTPQTEENLIPKTDEIPVRNSEAGMDKNSPRNCDVMETVPPHEIMKKENNDEKNKNNQNVPGSVSECVVEKNDVSQNINASRGVSSVTSSIKEVIPKESQNSSENLSMKTDDVHEVKGHCGVVNSTVIDRYSAEDNNLQTYVCPTVIQDSNNQSRKRKISREGRKDVKVKRTKQMDELKSPQGGGRGSSNNTMPVLSDSAIPAQQSPARTRTPKKVISYENVRRSPRNKTMKSVEPSPSKLITENMKTSIEKNVKNCQRTANLMDKRASDGKGSSDDLENLPTEISDVNESREESKCRSVKNKLTSFETKISMSKFVTEEAKAASYNDENRTDGKDTSDTLVQQKLTTNVLVRGYNCGKVKAKLTKISASKFVAKRHSAMNCDGGNRTDGKDASNPLDKLTAEVSTVEMVGKESKDKLTSSNTKLQSSASEEAKALSCNDENRTDGKDASDALVQPKLTMKNCKNAKSKLTSSNAELQTSTSVAENTILIQSCNEGNGTNTLEEIKQAGHDKGEKQEQSKMDKTNFLCAGKESKVVLADLSKMPEGHIEVRNMNNNEQENAELKDPDHQLQIPHFKGNIEKRNETTKKDVAPESDMSACKKTYNVDNEKRGVVLEEHVLTCRKDDKKMDIACEPDISAFIKTHNDEDNIEKRVISEQPVPTCRKYTEKRYVLSKANTSASKKTYSDEDSQAPVSNSRPCDYESFLKQSTPCVGSKSLKCNKITPESQLVGDSVSPSKSTNVTSTSEQPLTSKKKNNIERREIKISSTATQKRLTPQIPAAKEGKAVNSPPKIYERNDDDNSGQSQTLTSDHTSVDSKEPPTSYDNEVTPTIGAIAKTVKPKNGTPRMTNIINNLKSRTLLLKGDIPRPSPVTPVTTLIDVGMEIDIETSPTPEQKVKTSGSKKKNTKKSQKDKNQKVSSSPVSTLNPSPELNKWLSSAKKRVRRRRGKSNDGRDSCHGKPGVSHDRGGQSLNGFHDSNQLIDRSTSSKIDSVVSGGVREDIHTNKKSSLAKSNISGLTPDLIESMNRGSSGSFVHVVDEQLMDKSAQSRHKRTRVGKETEEDQAIKRPSGKIQNRVHLGAVKDITSLEKKNKSRNDEVIKTHEIVAKSSTADHDIACNNNDVFKSKEIAAESSIANHDSAFNDKTTVISSIEKQKVFNKNQNSCSQASVMKPRPCDRESFLKKSRSWDVSKTTSVAKLKHKVRKQGNRLADDPQAESGLVGKVGGSKHVVKGQRSTVGSISKQGTRLVDDPQSEIGLVGKVGSSKPLAKNPKGQRSTGSSFQRSDESMIQLGMGDTDHFFQNRIDLHRSAGQSEQICSLSKIANDLTDSNSQLSCGSLQAKNSDKVEFSCDIIAASLACEKTTYSCQSYTKAILPTPKTSKQTPHHSNDHSSVSTFCPSMFPQMSNLGNVMRSYKNAALQCLIHIATLRIKRIKALAQPLDLSTPSPRPLDLSNKKPCTSVSKSLDVTKEQYPMVIKKLFHPPPGNSPYIWTDSSPQASKGFSPALSRHPSQEFVPVHGLSPPKIDSPLTPSYHSSCSSDSASLLDSHKGTELKVIQGHESTQRNHSVEEKNDVVREECGSLLRVGFGSRKGSGSRTRGGGAMQRNDGASSRTMNESLDTSTTYKQPISKKSDGSLPSMLEKGKVLPGGSREIVEGRYQDTRQKKYVNDKAPESLGYNHLVNGIVSEKQDNTRNEVSGGRKGSLKRSRRGHDEGHIMSKVQRSHEDQNRTINKNESTSEIIKKNHEGKKSRKGERSPKGYRSQETVEGHKRNTSSPVPKHGLIQHNNKFNCGQSSKSVKRDRNGCTKGVKRTNRILKGSKSKKGNLFGNDVRRNIEHERTAEDGCSRTVGGGTRTVTEQTHEHSNLARKMSAESVNAEIQMSHSRRSADERKRSRDDISARNTIKATDNSVTYNNTEDIRRSRSRSQKSRSRERGQRSYEENYVKHDGHRQAMVCRESREQRTSWDRHNKNNVRQPCSGHPKPRVLGNCGSVLRRGYEQFQEGSESSDDFDHLLRHHLKQQRVPTGPHMGKLCDVRLDKNQRDRHLRHQDITDKCHQRKDIKDNDQRSVTSKRGNRQRTSHPTTPKQFSPEDSNVDDSYDKELMKTSPALSRSMWMASLKDCQERRKKQARWSSEQSETCEHLQTNDCSQSLHPRDVSGEREIQTKNISSRTGENNSGQKIREKENCRNTSALYSITSSRSPRHHTWNHMEVMGTTTDGQSLCSESMTSKKSDFVPELSMSSWQLSEESRCRFNSFAKVVQVLSPLKLSPWHRTPPRERKESLENKKRKVRRKVLQSPWK